MGCLNRGCGCLSLLRSRAVSSTWCWWKLWPEVRTASTRYSNVACSSRSSPAGRRSATPSPAKRSIAIFPGCAAARSIARSPQAWRRKARHPRRSRRSEEHTSELQSRRDLVCRLLLEKKKKENRKESNKKKKKKKKKKRKRQKKN